MLRSRTIVGSDGPFPSSTARITWKPWSEATRSARPSARHVAVVADLSANGLAQPFGDQAEEFGPVGQAPNQDHTPPGTSGLVDRSLQHGCLAEARLRLEKHLPVPLLDRVHQAVQRLIMGRERNIGRIQPRRRDARTAPSVDTTRRSSSSVDRSEGREPCGAGVASASGTIRPIVIASRSTPRIGYDGI